LADRVEPRGAASAPNHVPKLGNGDWTNFRGLVRSAGFCRRDAAEAGEVVQFG
jgi:hypothetical protein